MALVKKIQPPILNNPPALFSWREPLIRAPLPIRILQTVGTDIDKPYVLKTAFMGTAAANIEGQTLTSTFSMQFGNLYTGLGDRNREMKRQALAHLEILIIDEISMVKADMLYQLDMILK